MGDWNDAFYEAYDSFLDRGLSSQEAELATHLKATKQIYGTQAAKEALCLSRLPEESIERVKRAVFGEKKKLHAENGARPRLVT